MRARTAIAWTAHRVRLTAVGWGLMTVLACVALSACTSAHGHRHVRRPPASRVRSISLAERLGRDAALVEWREPGHLDSPVDAQPSPAPRSARRRAPSSSPYPHRRAGHRRRRHGRIPGRRARGARRSGHRGGRREHRLPPPDDQAPLTRNRDRSLTIAAGMLIAAAVCPHPPLLVPEATGAPGPGDPELERLRAACHQAVAALLAERPDLIAVVGADPEPGARPSTRRRPPGRLHDFGVPFTVGEAGPTHRPSRSP